LDPQQTKDGPVSLRPQELKELVDFSRMSQDELQAYMQREIPEYEQMIGLSQRPLSHTEELNRDYYRGRFASRVGDEVIYNWEERQVF
jgi:hypothetical protein